MALLAEGPQHGYALVEQLRASPMLDGVKPDDTGVYRLLRALEEQGLVGHRSAESERGPGRRVYKLTGAGRKCLRKWTATLDDYQRSVAKLVRMLRRA